MAGAGQGGGMNINIHIEELLLDGIDATPRQLAAMKSSFEARLTQLLAWEGIGVRQEEGGALRTIQTEPMGPVQDNDPSRLGERIARSVHGGLR